MAGKIRPGTVGCVYGGAGPIAQVGFGNDGLASESLLSVEIGTAGKMRVAMTWGRHGLI